MARALPYGHRHRRNDKRPWREKWGASCHRSHLPLAKQVAALGLGRTSFRLFLTCSDQTHIDEIVELIALGRFGPSTILRFSTSTGLNASLYQSTGSLCSRARCSTQPILPSRENSSMKSRASSMRAYRNHDRAVFAINAANLRMSTCSLRAARRGNRTGRLRRRC